MLRVLLAGRNDELNDRIEASIRVQWPTARISIIASLEEASSPRPSDEPDVVLVDAALPSLQRDQIEGIRADGPPVILLVNDGGFSEGEEPPFGADDYIVKPFSPLELVARIDAVRRCAPRRSADGHVPAELLMPGQPRTFDDGVLSVDFARRRARVQQRPVFLTTTEFDLLAQLLRSRGFVVHNQRLLAWAQRNSTADPAEYLSIHIRRLRDKIEPNPARPCYILAERGVGYKFSRPRPALPAASVHWRGGN